MKIGKVSESVLKRSVLRQIKTRRDEVKKWRRRRGRLRHFCVEKYRQFHVLCTGGDCFAAYITGRK